MDREVDRRRQKARSDFAHASRFRGEQLPVIQLLERHQQRRHQNDGDDQGNAEDRRFAHASLAPASKSRRSTCSAMKSAVFLTVSASRSEEHTSELQSLMRISYAVF